MTAGVGRNGGGTSEVVPRLCEALLKQGHEVRLLAISSVEISHSAINARAAGVDIRLYKKDRLFSRIAYGYSSELLKEIKEGIKWGEIIHTHGLWQLPPIYAAFNAYKAERPYVMQPHGFLEPERLKVSKSKKSIVGAIIERPMLNHAEAVIATSESEAEGIRRYGVKRPIHIMPIGLDTEKYRLSACTGKTLLYFSRITPIKGLDMLAEVWGRIDRQGWKLLIVGPDDRGYTDEMKRLFAVRCPSESYEFRPPVFGDEKFKLLSSVDALILPTRSENWSIAVAEAMVSGLPVVCTKGAPWKCLNDVKAGWWVDVSEAGLEQGLSEMMKLTNEERKAYGWRGHEWCEHHLSWGKIAQDMSSYYAECISHYNHKA